MVDFPLRDSCFGRCFVLGNGPSLVASKLNKLIPEVTFAVNRVSLIFDKTEWRPSYYVGVTTALWQEAHHEDIVRGIRESDTAFCAKNYLEFSHKFGTTPIIYLNCFHTGDHQTDEAQDDWWFDDISIGVSKFAVSVFPAIQIAAYLGFTEICLLGCDGGYSKPENGVDCSHFDAEYRPFDAYPDYDYDRLNAALQRAHEIAQINADRLGVKIYNLSEQSTITAHKKRRFEEFV